MQFFNSCLISAFVAISEPRIYECLQPDSIYGKVKPRKKKKKRIPVPKKPPKVEKDKKSYDRKSEKEKDEKTNRRRNFRQTQ